MPFRCSLVDQTAELSTVNTGDIYGVIATLIKVIAYELKFGRVIRLGDLGSFYLSIQSEGADTPEELTWANIHRAVLRFRPGRKLMEILRNLKFEKISNGNHNGQSDHAVDVEIKKKDA